MSLLFPYSPRCRMALASAIMIFCVMCVPALASSHGDTFTIAPEPDWVEVRSFDSTKALQTTQPVQYLLVDYQIKIDSSPYTEFNRYVSRAQNSTGVEEISQIKIAYNPSYQHLILHKIMLHRGKQMKDITQSSEVRFLQRERRLEQKIQDGIVDALVDIPGTRKGDVVEYSFSVTGRNPIFGAKVFGSGALSWGVDVDAFNFRLISDDRPLFFQTHGVDKSIKKNKVGEHIEYRYSDTDIKSEFDEGDYPYYETPYAWYEYTEYSSWSEVNRWASELYQFSDESNPKTKALVRDFLEKDLDDEDYVQASLSYVQNQIRYLGLEFGVNSHLPRSPDVVISNEYGDCKDKSVLLLKLLQEKDIPVYPALVSTAFREGLDKRLPSPGAFDHVINFVEISGKRYWLDGTRSYQAGSLGALGEDDYGYALIVDYQDRGLIKMYADGIAPDSITYEEHVTSESFDDDAIYSVETVYSGNLAEFKRYQFDNMSIPDIQKKYLDIYRYYYQDIYDIKAMEFEDNKDKNLFTIREYYKIPNYWLRDGDIVVARVNISSFSDFLREPEVRERTSDFLLRKPVKVVHDLYLNYPEEVFLDLSDEDVEHVHDSFTFTAKHRYEDKLYAYHGELTTSKHVVEQEHFQSYLNGVKDLKDQWYFSLSVADPERIDGFRELLALRKRLLQLSGDAQ